MRACGNHWSAQRQATRSNIIIGLLGLVVGVLLFTALRWLALVFLVSGFVLLTLVVLRAVLWRRAFREAGKYKKEIFVVFKDDSVHVESAEGRSDLNWSFFSGYLETPEDVLLYITKRNFSVIPKGAFSDEQAVQGFMNLVKSHLDSIR